MPREGFDRQLRELQQQVVVLGSMATKAVERSVTALRERDATLAREVITGDDPLDLLAEAIEERALLLIATQQPMAGDLRTIAAVLAITTELERIGDYAEGIAKLALRGMDTPPLKPLVDIPRMADLAVGMLRGSLDALIARDVDAAMAIWQRDDDVDHLQDQVHRELLTYMLADPRTIERATELFWIAHRLERIADRVTNICERIVVMVTGQRRKHAIHV